MKRKLKKIIDCAPLTMSEITREGVESSIKEPENTKEHINPQAKISMQPSDEVLEIVPLKVMFPNKEKGKSSKSSEQSKSVTPSNVSSPMLVSVASKPSNETKNVVGNDSDNINQLLETLNACDNPASENNIDKILIENPVLEKPLNNPYMDIDPSTI